MNKNQRTIFIVGLSLFVIRVLYVPVNQYSEHRFIFSLGRASIKLTPFIISILALALVVAALIYLTKEKEQKDKERADPKE